MENTVLVNGEYKRCGYTTGSCAAAASKAACDLLFNKKRNEFIEIDTPSGIRLNLEVLDLKEEEGYVSCAIMKDGGDDPDVTTGLLIYAKAEFNDEFIIDGGIGVGRHTETTFLGKKGEAAINKVPRQMIEKEVMEVTNGKRNVKITISVPLGEETAKNTMNRVIGVSGGISIIGTSGIVKPMSSEAIIKTFCLEMDLRLEKNNNEEIYLTLGNYGTDYLKKIDPKIDPVMISNYIGEAFNYLNRKKVKKVHLIGHIGKMCKLAAGCYNTHSQYADIRIITFVYYLALKGAKMEVINEVNQALTAQDATKICLKHGYKDVLSDMEGMCVKNLYKFLKKTDMEIDVKIYLMD